MKRNVLSIVLAALALLIAAGTLVFQWTGSPNAGVGRTDVATLKTQVAALQARGSGLRIAMINPDAAFSVFMNAIADLRQAVSDKSQEIATLNTSYQNGSTSASSYQMKLPQLNAELLDARVSADVGTLDHMIASSAFADMRTSLQSQRDASQALVDAVKSLVSMAKDGVGNTADFQNRFTQAQNGFTQLDQFVAQAATTKLQQVVKKIAMAQGIDLVVPVKNVVLYVSAAAVPDLTELVKTEMASYL